MEVGHKSVTRINNSIWHRLLICTCLCFLIGWSLAVYGPDRPQPILHWVDVIGPFTAEQVKEVEARRKADVMPDTLKREAEIARYDQGVIFIILGMVALMISAGFGWPAVLWRRL